MDYGEMILILVGKISYKSSVIQGSSKYNGRLKSV